MTFKVITATLLLAGLTSFAAGPKTPAKKQARKTASKVMCVPVDTAFDFDYSEGYTLSEVQALRNSIFAQYGYNFTDSDIKAEMIERGCLKNVPYKYSNLTDKDKKNIKMLKQIEADLAEYATIDFEKEWNKTAGKPKARAKLLDYAYCQIVGNDDWTLLGLLHFSTKKNKDGKYTLEGMLDLSNAKMIEPETEGKLMSLDSTSIRAIDSTSAAGVQWTAKGTWSVDANGDVVVAINPLTKKSGSTKVKISAPDYSRTKMLSCKVAQ